MSDKSYPEWEACRKLLLDPNISEIETNGPNDFFIKKSGKRLHLDGVKLNDDKRYLDGIEFGLVPFVKQISPFDRNSFLFEGPIDYTLEGQRIRGRCHIVLPPACDTAQVTIAKKSTALATLEDIAKRGSMSADMLVFMDMMMRASLTVAFSGGTGAGKTTMLEACSKLIPDSVRIGVAEDTPELSLTQPNVSYLHSFPWRPGMDPNEVATLSWVVSQFQRMRTDRLIIGETRGKEFADFLIAANSGMDGSLTTIHANSPVRCLEKMTNFAMKGSEKQPVRSINLDIANAIDVIVQLVILPDGRHKIDAIQEITKTVNDKESATISTNPLYKYDVVTDSFTKVNNITEDLRKKFIEKAIDIEPLFKNVVGTKQLPIGVGAAKNQTAKSGMPPLGPRRL